MKPLKRRRILHFVPPSRYRTSDAVRHCDRLLHALRPWIDSALAGNKVHRLAAENCSVVNRSEESIRCDVAHALASAIEWDGFSIAHELKLRGWPADVDLVRVCNVWSCSLYGVLKAERLAQQQHIHGTAAA